MVGVEGSGAGGVEGGGDWWEFGGKKGWGDVRGGGIDGRKWAEVGR